MDLEMDAEEARTGTLYISEEEGTGEGDGDGDKREASERGARSWSEAVEVVDAMGTLWMWWTMRTSKPKPRVGKGGLQIPGHSSVPR